MAIYFREPEAPAWLSPLEQTLKGIGSLGSSAIEASSMKKKTEEAAKDLESIGYAPEEAKQIARLGDQAIIQAIQQKRQNDEKTKQAQTYAQMLSMGNQQKENAQTAQPNPAQQRINAAVASGVMSPKEAIKALQDIETSESKDISSRQKAAAPAKEKIIEDYRVGRLANDSLQELQDLTNYGDMDSPGWITTLRAFGLDSPALMKNDSAVFQKVQNDFLPLMKRIFGGRITDRDMSQFLKGLPDLAQSKEGRLKVIKIMKTVNKASKVRFDTLDDLEEQYGDKLPHNWQTILEKKSSKKLDAISKQLRDIHIPEAATQEAQEREFKSAELPPAANFEGRILVGPQGQKIKSVNGKWIIVG